MNLIVGIAMLLRLAEEGAYEVRRKSELKLTVIFVNLLLIITSFSVKATISCFARVVKGYAC